MSEISNFSDQISGIKKAFKEITPLLETVERMKAAGIPVDQVLPDKFNKQDTVEIFKKPEHPIEPRERYDLSNGLHIANKYFGQNEKKNYTQNDIDTYTEIIAMFDENVRFDEESHELVFDFAEKTWNFCLITECCQIRILTAVLRRLYDLHVEHSKRN